MGLLIIAQFIAVGALATVGLSHAFIYARQPGPKVHLLFALTAFGSAANAVAEVFFYQSVTVAAFNPAFKWSNSINAFWFIALVGFVVVYTGGWPARRRPAFALATIFVFAAVANTLLPYGFLYQDITGLREVVLPWGESFVTAVGTTSLRRVFTDLAFIGVIALTFEGTVRLWRRGDRRSAWFLGGSLLLYLVLLLVTGIVVDLGLVEIPYLYTFGYVAVALAMSYQLAGDVARASRLAAEVKSNERRWRSLLENVEMLVAGVNREGRIDYVNPYFTEVSGFSSVELIGKPIAELLPEQDKELLLAFQEALEGRVRPLQEASLTTKSGDERRVIWRSVALREPRGEIAGTLSIGADVTERRKAEAARDRALNDAQKALEEVESLKRRLEEEVIYLKSEITTIGHFDTIVGESDAIQYVLQKIEEVAPLDTTVLIEGETGVGKELVARAIHEHSPRRQRSLVKVNCAALPANLIEAELFGHERGAFTGAVRLRKGRFELANGGTLFLDEIGELPLDLQGKLLRVLEGGELERVGGEATIQVDVRVLAATNRNLKEEVDAGRFREDLFYRLHVYPITVPTLRQRKDDVLLLVNSFVRRLARAQGKQIDQIPQPVLDELVRYDWPGNVRELENVIERAVVTTRDNKLHLAAPLTPTAVPAVEDGAPATYRGSLEHVERDYIGRVLELSDWRIEGNEGAAELLGLHPNTLRFRMRKLGIKRPSKPA